MASCNNQIKEKEQTDAHAALMTFINQFGMECDASFLDLMSFYVEECKSCPSCKNSVSSRSELYRDIHPPIPLMEDGTQRDRCTLRECLDQFSKSTLDKNCDSCMTPLSQELSLISAPEVLILRLRRDSFAQGRINTLVDFSLNEIDLRDYVQGGPQDAIYVPYAIINHISASLERGHYTSYIRIDEDSWLELDDSRCMTVQTDHIVDVDNVVLLLRKKTVEWRRESIDTFSSRSQINPAPR